MDSSFKLRAKSVVHFDQHLASPAKTATAKLELLVERSQDTVIELHEKASHLCHQSQATW